CFDDITDDSFDVFAQEVLPVGKQATKMPSHSEPDISVFLWIVVMVVVSGSMLVLLFWIVVYKRQVRNQGRRRQQRAGEDRAGPNQPRPRTAPALTLAAEEPSPTSCPHANGGPTNHRLQDTAEGDARADHGVTLPATELGDAALVTTKMVQRADGSLL
uniref:Uncharacterized protein n=1 Tax=Denticeps clupeoides TaxID=299321 RepID=A0AAY4C6X3_9TELE